MNKATKQMTKLFAAMAMAGALLAIAAGLRVVPVPGASAPLAALVALLARLYGPLIQLSNLRVDIMTALVSFSRVFEILDGHLTHVEQSSALSH